MKRIVSLALTLILTIMAFGVAGAATPSTPANDLSIRPDMKLEKVLVLDFTATWCGPCKLMAPAFKQAAEYCGDRYTFMSIDVDKYPKTAAAFGIDAVPTIVMIPPEGESVRFVGISDFLSELGSSATYQEKVDAICEGLMFSVQLLDALY